MELPESLPARLYLLAYDKRRQRLAARTRHRRRITRLTERGGSAAPALHRVVQLVKGSAAG